ncbi:ATP-binding protein [Magnetococcales bacterium HHB-1]
MALPIPRVNDSLSDFQWLFKIWNQANESKVDVRFQFSHCDFLRPNAVAFLGGLARLIQYQQRKVVFDWDTLTDNKVLTNLRQNGFAETFGYPTTHWSGNSIPYREDSDLDMNSIMDYLTDRWIGKGWVNVSDALRDAIVGNIWEIYNNAFEHSETPIGVFSCGQHFPNRKELALSVVDFGQSIPTTVKNYFLFRGVTKARVAKLSGADCMQWAFQRGHSTCKQGIPRGLGFELLQNFISRNHGKLEIYSGNGYAIIDQDGHQFRTLKVPFTGTMVYTKLCCNDKLYTLGNETR